MPKQVSSPFCLFEGCGRKSKSVGLCTAHYGQRNRGEILRPIKRSQPPERFCEIADCGEVHYGRGLCSRHYSQKRAGKPLTPRRTSNLCTFEGCTRKYSAKGLCASHYSQKSLGRTLSPINRNDGRPCSFDGCERPMKNRKLCLAHYSQWQSGGPLKPIQIRGDWRVGTGGYIIRTNFGDGPAVISQHREVMEEYIGRQLVEKENVHHINGDRTDNRIENLELWNTSQPAGQRVEDKVAWAKEILALYEPESLVKPQLRLAA